MEQHGVPVVQGVVVGKPEVPSPYQTPAIFRAANAHLGTVSAPPPLPQAQMYEDAMQCKDPRLPPEIRLSFIKKVYGILFSMLVVTFGISTPFIFHTARTLGFLMDHQWIVALVSAILLVQYMVNMCMLCGAMCGSYGMMQGYIQMMKTVPWNYIYLFVFAGCFGVVVGLICAQYTVQSVLLVFAVSAVLVLALTAYAVWTKADFTGCGAYIMVLLVGLLLVILVAAFFPNSKLMHKIIGGAGAVVFGFLIVYDTQQIFGSASEFLGGGSRQMEYSIDMYAFAAWNLYLDFLNFFLYLLQLFGSRRD
jgi:protein lifeguard